jgi:hypothetical protein
LVSDSVRRNSKRNIRHISVYCTEFQGFSYDFWVGIKLILRGKKGENCKTSLFESEYMCASEGMFSASKACQDIAIEEHFYVSS